MKREVHDKENLLDILESARFAIKEKNTILLKELSNRTIHSASIYQDTSSITVAVIVYALYNLFSRPDYEKFKDWKMFLFNVDFNLDRAIKNLNNNDISGFEKDLVEIRKIVSKLAEDFKKYVEEVFRKALITKASRIYEHGISMEQTAHLLGITIFELAEYAGRTGIADVNLGITMDIEKRLKKSMEFFK